MAAARNVVVVGASAGGVEALSSFASSLPTDLPAAVLVVLHVAPAGTSVLAGILQRAGALPAQAARDGDRLEQGRLYVAVPDRHLVLEDGIVRIPHSPRESGHRPAVDTLFRSAAAGFGAHVIAVVLSGAQDDGTAGAAAVKAVGGRVAVQEPADAQYPSMPRSVLASVEADGRGTAPALAALVVGWLGEDAAADGPEGTVGLAAPLSRPAGAGAEPRS